MNKKGLERFNCLLDHSLQTYILKLLLISNKLNLQTYLSCDAKL